MSWFNSGALVSLTAESKAALTSVGYSFKAVEYLPVWFLHSFTYQMNISAARWQQKQHFQPAFGGLFKEDIFVIVRKAQV